MSPIKQINTNASNIVSSYVAFATDINTNKIAAIMLPITVNTIAACFIISSFSFCFLILSRLASASASFCSLILLALSSTILCQVPGPNLKSTNVATSLIFS
jgi:hypothetical protein